MERTLLVLVATLGALGGSVASAQEAPGTELALSAFCEAFEVAPAECRRARVERVGQLDLAPATPAWVFTLVEGGPEVCRIRHACFVVVTRSGELVLSGMGQEVAAVPRGARADLIVTASSTAAEFEAFRHRWRRGRYPGRPSSSCW